MILFRSRRQAACSDRPPRLLSRTAGILASVVLLTLFLGCMSLNIGQLHPSEDGVLTQSGTLTYHGSKPQTVYYPIPYASTPNLTLKDSWKEDDWEIIDQQSDHFTVRRKDFARGSTPELTWTAKGLRGPPPAPPVVVTSTSAAPSPATPVLPAAPEPVDQTGK
jgi:hypothetical protein